MLDRPFKIYLHKEKAYWKSGDFIVHCPVSEDGVIDLNLADGPVCPKRLEKRIEADDQLEWENS